MDSRIFRGNNSIWLFIHSQLIWVSDNLNGTGTLMTTDIVSGRTRTFLNNPQDCGSNLDSNQTIPLNIPSLALQTVTTVDWSDVNNPRLLWTAYDNIWSSDLKGCRIFNSTEIKRTGRFSFTWLVNLKCHCYFYLLQVAGLYLLWRWIDCIFIGRIPRNVGSTKFVASKASSTRQRRHQC